MTSRDSERVDAARRGRSSGPASSSRRRAAGGTARRRRATSRSSENVPSTCARGSPALRAVEHRAHRASEAGDVVALDERAAAGSTTAAAPPTRVATTGTPAACASIRLTGVPSLSDVSTTTSLAKQTRRHVALKARPDDPRRAAGSARSSSRSSPSPATRNQTSPRSAASRRATARKRSTRLIGTSRATSVTTPRVGRDAEPRAQLAARAARRVGRVDVEAARGRGPSAHDLEALRPARRRGARGRRAPPRRRRSGASCARRGSARCAGTARPCGREK